MLPLGALNAWIILLVLQYFQALVIVVGTAILLAFILEYPVQLLQRFRLSRVRSVLVILLVTLTVLAVSAITLIPALIGQVSQLVTNLPNWIESGVEQFKVFQEWAQSLGFQIDLGRLLTQLEERLSSQLQALSGNILNIALNTVTRILDFLLTIVLTFYLLLHGQRLWEGVFQWLPPKLGLQIQHSLQRNFHNYFVGQATLAMIMGAIMTTLFLIIQVPFGLLFGIVIGTMTFFPFGASLSIGIVSLLMALKNIWLGIKVLALAVVVQQIVENVIAPQLIGKFTGLNPIWILISLLIGAKVGGLLGVVIAVPIASSIKSMADQIWLATQAKLAASTTTVESNESVSDDHGAD